MLRVSTKDFIVTNSINIVFDVRNECVTEQVKRSTSSYLCGHARVLHSTLQVDNNLEDFLLQLSSGDVPQWAVAVNTVHHCHGPGEEDVVIVSYARLRLELQRILPQRQCVTFFCYPVLQ